MEPTVYLDHLRSDGDRLRAAATQGLDCRIPTCPAWDMAALVAHVGSGHRWFADIVQARTTEDPRRFPSAPADTRALLTWYDEGFVELIEVLSAIPPDEQIWNWFDNKPAPARFWHRRASLETAIHRWDAQLATGLAEPRRSRAGRRRYRRTPCLHVFFLPVQAHPRRWAHEISAPARDSTPRASGSSAWHLIESITAAPTPRRTPP